MREISYLSLQFYKKFSKKKFSYLEKGSFFNIKISIIFCLFIFIFIVLLFNVNNNNSRSLILLIVVANYSHYKSDKIRLL